jgi:DNA-directed RNA polymerase subunit RPC12/RpoP
MAMCAYILPVNLLKTFKGTLTIPPVSVSFLSVGGAKLKIMWMCLNCKARIRPQNVTHDEKCEKCGEKVYTQDELEQLYNKFCGFERRHDLFDIWEQLNDVKKNPKAETAQNELWIDVIIRRIKKMEESFFVRGENER